MSSGQKVRVIIVQKVRVFLSAECACPYSRVTHPIKYYLKITLSLKRRYTTLQPPRQHPGWQLMQAVDWGPACPQPVRFTGATKGIRDMDEDCLYLNIFSPNVSHLAYKLTRAIHHQNFGSSVS